MLNQVEYYTSEDEAEASDMDPPSREAAETMRQYEGEEENSLICINCGALGDVLEEGGDQSEFRLIFLRKIFKNIHNIQKYWWLNSTPAGVMIVLFWHKLFSPDATSV